MQNKATQNFLVFQALVLRLDIEQTFLSEVYCLVKILEIKMFYFAARKLKNFNLTPRIIIMQSKICACQLYKILTCYPL